MTTTRRRIRTALFGTAAAAALAGLPAPAAAQSRQFDVPAQSAADAVTTLARQAEVQILLPGRIARGVRTNAVSGDMPVEEALARMLAGTGLVAQKTGAGTWTVVGERDAAAGNAGRASSYGRASLFSGEDRAAGAATDNAGADVGATPEILVIGSQTINTDVRRTESDVQPYVVFSRTEIESSQAPNIEEFLRTRLPMNQSLAANSQLSGTNSGNISSINLRGLGANQTLILVDGRRLPSVSLGLGLSQPNINGIPLSSIDRIEILPATAGGIYGGGATGGVINIITHQNYSGLDIQMSYGSATRGDAENAQVNISAGVTFGSTSLRFSASAAEYGGLSTRDRDGHLEEPSDFGLMAT